MHKSQAIYQFLVAVRSSDGTGPSVQLANEAGEVTRCICSVPWSSMCCGVTYRVCIVTIGSQPNPMVAASLHCSHLQGMWYRTLKFLESGIKPVYVFDGKPPTLKSGQVGVKACAHSHIGQCDRQQAANGRNNTRLTLSLPFTVVPAAGQAQGRQGGRHQGHGGGAGGGCVRHTLVETGESNIATVSLLHCSWILEACISCPFHSL